MCDLLGTGLKIFTGHTHSHPTADEQISNTDRGVFIFRRFRGKITETIQYTYIFIGFQTAYDSTDKVNPCDFIKSFSIPDKRVRVFRMFTARCTFPTNINKFTANIIFSGMGPAM